MGLKFADWIAQGRVPDPFGIAYGLYEGLRWVDALGERESMGTTAAGEDVWKGSATTIPTPVDAGEQMEIVSSSAGDEDGPGGSGIITILLDLILADGTVILETVTMNGNTPVVLANDNVRFVNDMCAVTVGSNGVAVGEITIYKQGSSSTIYSMVAIGNNRAVVPRRMVPINKKLLLTGWHATEAQNKRVAIRLRSTDHDGILYPGVYCFKDTSYLKQSSSGHIPLHELIPALSVVKITGWPVVSGAEVGCSWRGILVDD